MPSTTQPQDVRVGTSSHFGLQVDQPQRLSVEEASPTFAVCTAPCCSPMHPHLNRSAVSHPGYALSNDLASLSSMGTDGTSTQSEDGGALPEFGDALDANTFEQILEMDDDEDEREFSKSIVYDFFDQAQVTFKNMDDSLEKKDLYQLSALGHFLKGSSATLGLTKVKDSCEKIQHFGAQKNETGDRDEPDKEKCLANCRKTIEQAKVEFKEVEKILRKFYHDDKTGAASA